MSKDKRFKVGDSVTYKDAATQSNRFGEKGRYWWNGTNQHRYQGVINNYGLYIEKAKCWTIRVTTKSGGSYSMLESEFEEYDLKKQSTLNKIFSRTKRKAESGTFSEATDSGLSPSPNRRNQPINLKYD